MISKPLPTERQEVPSDIWQGLAEAVIVQAAKDYRTTLRCLCKKPGNTMKLRELEAFFRSRWFQKLCDLDGKRLMWRLKNGVRGKRK